MTKENFKNKLEGNELDLSVLGLDEVPVKEIASLVKATHIDLSCNRILNIPSSFCGLQQIVKLDLSKNVIESLPFNFGDLSKLQYLDLDSNRIMMLPISFGNLKSLRWLDLKKNPLDPQLKAIAGDCVDAKQCQNCAKRVVKFMQKVEEQYLLEDQRNQKQFEEVKDNLKAERLKKEEKQTVNKKATNEKKTTTTGQKKNQLHQTVTESKEKSNRNEKQKKVTQVVQQRSKVTLNETLPQQNGKRKTNEKKQPTKSSSLSNKKSKAKSNNKTSKSWSFFTLLLASVFLLATTLAAVLCFYTGGDMSSEAIQKAIPNVKADVAKLVDIAEMKLNDFIQWVKTDGRKTFSWATEIVISFCGDLLEISIQCFSHAKENSEHFFGLLKKWIESSSTITTTTPPNAKPM